MCWVFVFIYLYLVFKFLSYIYYVKMFCIIFFISFFLFYDKDKNRWLSKIIGCDLYTFYDLKRDIVLLKNIDLLSIVILLIMFCFSWLLIYICWLYLIVFIISLYFYVISIIICLISGNGKINPVVSDHRVLIFIFNPINRGFLFVYSILKNGGKRVSFLYTIYCLGFIQILGLGMFTLKFLVNVFIILYKSAIHVNWSSKKVLFWPSIYIYQIKNELYFYINNIFEEYNVVKDKKIIITNRVIHTNPSMYEFLYTNQVYKRILKEYIRNYHGQYTTTMFKSGNNLVGCREAGLCNLVLSYKNHMGIILNKNNNLDKLTLTTAYSSSPKIIINRKNIDVNIIKTFEENHKISFIHSVDIPKLSNISSNKEESKDDYHNVGYKRLKSDSYGVNINDYEEKIKVYGSPIMHSYYEASIPVQNYFEFFTYTTFCHKNQIKDFNMTNVLNWLNVKTEAELSYLIILQKTKLLIDTNSDMFVVQHKNPNKSYITTMQNLKDENIISNEDVAMIEEKLPEMNEFINKIICECVKDTIEEKDNLDVLNKIGVKSDKIDFKLVENVFRAKFLKDLNRQTTKDFLIDFKEIFEDIIDS